MFPILMSRNMLMNTFIIVFLYRQTEYKQEFDHFANG